MISLVFNQNQQVMKKNMFLFLVLSFSINSFSQIIIKGSVHNDSIPLESASVIIKNSKRGVATNAKGQFKIEAKKGDTLSISYLGYDTKEIIVNKNENLNVQLEAENYLDEVVIEAYSYSRRICCGMSCVLICIDGESSSELIKLYPNPSLNGIFQLKLDEDYEEVKIMVSNLSGQIIQNSVHQKFGNKLNVNLSEFATGIYIINIIVDGKSIEAVKAIRS